MRKKNSKIIFVAGPTASGKTALAVGVARRFGGEVISADSMQIYRGLNIGTAKPKPEETLGVPHHLIDFVDPRGEYSAALYQRDARRLIEDIRSAGKIPVVAGGTGLYIHSLLYDMNFSRTGKNPDARALLETRYDEIGGEKMLAELSSSNPDIAEKLHKNDKKRIIRALESAVYGVKPAEDEFYRSEFYERNDIIFIGLNASRDILYEKINRRADKMGDGLIEEIETLLAAGVSFDCQSMQSIGYKEWREYFSRSILKNAENNNTARDAVMETVKRHTRNYAKRQITWFKRYNGWITWFDSSLAGFEEDVFRLIERV
jgi:tRNA dimethylallyltransferase